MALIALPLFFLPLGAQDEIDYARRLADYGYFELSTHQLNQIKNNESASKALKSYIPVVRSYMNMRKAERQQDPVKRVKDIESALGQLKKFVSNNTDHPRLADARKTYAETLRKAGKLWIKIAQRNSDKVDQAKSSGAKHLQRAIQQYSKIAGNVEGYDRCLNKLNGIISHHELARLYEATGQTKKRTKRLKEVLGKIDDYLWSSCATKHDTLKIRARTYAAVSHLGLSQVQKKKGNDGKAGKREEKAETYFNSVTDLVNVLKPKKNQQQKMTRTKFTVINNLVLRAYKFWVESLHDSGEADQVLNRSGEILAKLRNIPHPFKRGVSIDPAEFRPGRELLLLRAEAMHRKGERQGALDIAKRLTNWTGNTSKAAEELVNKWSEALGPEPLTPERALEKVDEFVAGSSYMEALNMITKGRSKISSRQGRVKWEWKFLDRKAVIYAKLERWYESAVMYEHIHDYYHEVVDLPLKRDSKQNQTFIEKVLKNDRNDFQSLRELVIRANYLAARSYGMVRQSSSFEADKKRYTALLNHLDTEHPDSEWADKTVILKGDLLQEQGEYDQAIESYGQPEKGTTVWEQAQLKIGYTYYLKGQDLEKKEKPEQAKKAFLDGVKVLSNYLDYLRGLDDELTDDQRNRAWSALDTIAYDYRQNSVKMPDKLLETLDDEVFDEFDFSAVTRSRALRHRMKAYIQKNDHEAAANVAERLFEEYENTPATTKALLGIANHFQKLREKAEGRADKQSYRSKEVSFYYRWISRKLASGGAKANDMLSIAQKLRFYGVTSDDQKALKRANELLNTLQEMGDASISEKEILEERALVLTYSGELEKAAEIYDRLGDVNELSILNGKARLFMKQMERAKEEGNREKRNDLLDKAKGFISQNIITPSEEESEIWWRGWRTFLEVQVIGGEQQKACRNYKLLRKRKNDEGVPFGGHIEMYKKLIDDYPGYFNCL